MDVHVDEIRGHLDRQKRNRKTAREQQAPVRLAQSVLQRAVADMPTVEKQILHPIVRAALAGMGHVTGQTDVAVAALDPQQILGQPCPKKRAIRSSH